MKKIIIILFIIVLTCGCSNGNLKNIKVNDLEEKLNNKETFILYLTINDEEGTTLKNTLKEVSKDNDLKTFFISTDKLNDNDKSKLDSLFTTDELNTIIFVKNGSENSTLSRITDSYISQSKLKEEFKTQGYIKEK